MSERKLVNSRENRGKELLRLEGVSKRYRVGGREQAVVENVNLTVSRGEVVWLTGPSGVGKSTVVRIAGLLSTPTSGKVEIDGVDGQTVKNQALYRAKTIGIVFQNANLLGEITLAGNLAVAALHSSDDERRAAMRRFGLDQVMDTPAKQLSGGEAQRAALCRALVNSPALLLADEPTSALDEANAGQVLSALAECAHEGIGVLIASHDPRVADIASRTVALSNGQTKRGGL